MQLLFIPPICSPPDGLDVSPGSADCGTALAACCCGLSHATSSVGSAPGSAADSAAENGAMQCSCCWLNDRLRGSRSTSTSTEGGEPASLAASLSNTRAGSVADTCDGRRGVLMQKMLSVHCGAVPCLHTYCFPTANLTSRRGARNSGAPCRLAAVFGCESCFTSRHSPRTSSCFVSQPSSSCA